MIIKFKIFESVNEKPKLGDYVICNTEDNTIPAWYERRNELKDFISTNIGIIQQIDNNSAFGGYKIKFKNDEIIKDYCQENNWKQDTLELDFNDIKYWSNNIEDLEPLISGVKYNL